MSNVDRVGSFNSWTHVAFDENKWTELVNNLESTKADWDDSDRKDNEPEENSNEAQKNVDWNKYVSSPPPLSRSSYNHSTTPPSPLSNNDISNYFETLGIAITSCFRKLCLHI